jgi:hypothetical protein
MSTHGTIDTGTRLTIGLAVVLIGAIAWIFEVRHDAKTALDQVEQTRREVGELRAELKESRQREDAWREETHRREQRWTEEVASVRGELRVMMSLLQQLQLESRNKDRK